jgi:hypothetical protein
MRWSCESSRTRSRDFGSRSTRPDPTVCGSFPLQARVSAAVPPAPAKDERRAPRAFLAGCSVVAQEPGLASPTWRTASQIGEGARALRAANSAPPSCAPRQSIRPPAGHPYFASTGVHTRPPVTTPATRRTRRKRWITRTFRVAPPKPTPGLEPGPVHYAALGLSIQGQCDLQAIPRITSASAPPHFRIYSVAVPRCGLVIPVGCLRRVEQPSALRQLSDPCAVLGSKRELERLKVLDASVVSAGLRNR